MARNFVNDRHNHRPACLGSRVQRLFVDLVEHRVASNVFRKRGQREGGLEFLGMSRPAARLEMRLGHALRQEVPIRLKLQVDLETLLELAPHSQAGGNVSAVTVEDQNVFEACLMHAANSVMQHSQPAPRHCSQRPRVSHVMLADADVHRR